ncbi:MAG: SAM-dependent methyltransferase [Betaproteobacteria bacterium]|nr:SAM-dependent methyltransferase [Betaproteobacteria bacterium]
MPTPLGDDVPLQRLLPVEAVTRCATLQHWVAENAKTCRAFLKRVGAVQPLTLPLQQIDIVELPKHQALTAQAARALLAPAVAGHDMGLVSEAGAPGVADPGAAVVAAAHALGIAVQPWVGPSSLLLALMASGLNGQQFAFHGYLPREAAARGHKLQQLEADSARLAQTQLFIETPYRNDALLAALLQALKPATRVGVAAGLTTAQQWLCTRAVADWRLAPMPALHGVPTVFSLLA